MTCGKLQSFDPIPKGKYPGSIPGLCYISRYQLKLDLQNDVEQVNAMLRHEMSSPATCQQFLEDDLARLLPVALSWPRSYIVTKSLLPLASFTDPEKALIAKYESSAKPQITGSTWSLNYNVLTHDGAIENWVVTGSLPPLAITTFQKNAAEPVGALSDLSIAQLESHYKEPKPLRPPLITNFPTYEFPKEIFLDKLTFQLNIKFLHGQIEDLIPILEQKSKELDPDKIGVPFTLSVPIDPRKYHPGVVGIDSSYSLYSVCDMIAGQTNLRFTIDNSGVHFTPNP